jgi:hypothetical protein
MQAGLLNMLACAVAITTFGANQASSARPPLDAIATILDAFRDHAVVALDEVHGDERSHAFRLSLIRDARFAATVDDILVEFGNSRYQG